MNPIAAKTAWNTIYERYDGLSSYGHITGEVFERIIRGLYTMLTEEGDALLDLGACHGLHTLPMAECVGAKGLVIAFEPIPNCREKIHLQAVQSGLASRIRLQPVALSNQRGTATFYTVDGNIIGHSGLRKKLEYPGGVQPKEIRVETALLDEFAPPEHRVRFVKADLEGGEFHALLGGRKLLQDHRPVVVMESALAWDAKQFGYRPEEFFTFFQQLDYQIKDILGCPFLPDGTTRTYPHYLVCYPRERASEISDILTLAVMEQTFGARWFNLPAS